MADKAEANKAKNAGNVNFKNGKYEEALKSYDLAVKLDPEEVFINNEKISGGWGRVVFQTCSAHFCSDHIYTSVV